MIRFLFSISILISGSVFSNNVLNLNDIIYYQSNYDSESKSEDLIAYITKQDPCISVINLDDNKTKRYCEMGNSGINLEKEYPTAYVLKLYVSPISVSFIVAAPWNEQKCKILAFHEKITCEPTGKN